MTCMKASQRSPVEQMSSSFQRSSSFQDAPASRGRGASASRGRGASSSRRSLLAPASSHALGKLSPVKANLEMTAPKPVVLLVLFIADSLSIHPARILACTSVHHSTPQNPPVLLTPAPESVSSLLLALNQSVIPLPNISKGKTFPFSHLFIYCTSRYQSPISSQFPSHSSSSSSPSSFPLRRGSPSLGITPLWHMKDFKKSPKISYLLLKNKTTHVPTAHQAAVN